MSDSNAPLTDSSDLFNPIESERARIRQLIKKLKPSALKYLSVDLPLSPTARTNFYDILVEHLITTDDKHWRERAVAAWGMGFANISGDEREKAITALRSSLCNRGKKSTHHTVNRLANISWRTYLFCAKLSAVFILFIFAAGRPTEEGPPFGFLGTFLLVVAFGGGLGVLAFWPVVFPVMISNIISQNNEARAMAAKSLVRQNAVEAIPEILEGALDKSDAVQKECRVALHHFLPQMIEAESNLFPANSEALLSRIIVTTYDIEHGSVIVDCLGKFGRGSSADAMTKHLRELCRDYSGSLMELEAYKAKVGSVLALLRERQNQDYARQELLRHSSIPTTQLDQLLRPATDAQTTPAEQLLRASNSGNRE